MWNVSHNSLARFAVVTLACCVHFGYAKPSDTSAATAAFDAAKLEANRDCASPRARKLFNRALSLGEKFALDHLVRTYDPLFCRNTGTDPAIAAKLYRQLAANNDSSAKWAIESWAKLVDKGLASPFPYPNVPTMLAHYGTALLGSHYADALELLKQAYLSGNEDAYEALRKASTSYSSGTGNPQRDQEVRANAACILGKALSDRFPDGSRDNEAQETLLNCKQSSYRSDLIAKRFRTGRASESELIWWLDEKDRYYSLNSDETTVKKVISSLTTEQSTEAARLAVSHYLFNSAEHARPESLSEWLALRSQLDVALNNDPSKMAELRFADVLFAAALEAGSDPTLQASRLDTLRTVVTIYERNIAILTAEKLTRLTVLAWKGFGDATSSSRVQHNLQDLTKAGDSSATNTIAYYRSLSSDTQVEVASLSRIDAIPRNRYNICKKENLESAIDVNHSLYRRLTLMRGLPNIADEVVNGTRGVSIFSVIPKHTAVLVYGRDFLRHCVWLLDKNGIAAFASVLVSDGLINAQLQRYLQSEEISSKQSSRFPLLKVGVPPFNSDTVQIRASPSPLDNDEAYRLSLLLLPGTVGERVGAYKHLAVVPYGVLGSIPFSAMRTSRKGPPLLDTSTVSIAPSIVDLLASSFPLSNNEGYRRVAPACSGSRVSRGLGTASLRAALVVGDPDFSSGDPNFTIPQLPGARAEAIDVASILGVRAFVGSEATLSTVRGEAGKARILYFATHGFSYGRDGLNGFLALAGDRWTASEIQRTCLSHVQLAVLSACQTGLGQATDGGIIGLARAFQIAGVSDVVMSLWNVNDGATQTLMTQFMVEIQRGARPPAALRSAMIETRKIYAEPRLWAGFTVFSDRFNAP